VPFMSYDGKVGISSTDRYLAAQVPYAGGRFAAQFVMPTKGTLDELIASLTPGDLARIGAAPVTDHEGVLIPKFTTRSFVELDGVLRQLGMRSAFSSGADFSQMSATPLAVDTVVQRDYLRVDERGTEAAAVTGIAMAAAGHSVIAFDHPFLFVVRDVHTAAILFAGRIENPAAG
jgi:serpin B